MQTDNNIEDVIQKMQELSLQNKFRIEEWRIFFESEDMRLVMIQPRVLRALGDCFYLKRIDTAFFEYLREQLDKISDRLKEYGVDYAESEEMAAFRYARSKVRSAHQYEDTDDKVYAKRLRIVLAIIAVCFPILSSYMISMDRQRQAQKLKEDAQMWEEMRELQRELQEQQDSETNEWLRNSIEADPNAREAVIQEIKELMETSSLSQEYFDKLLEDLGIDPNELEE